MFSDLGPYPITAGTASVRRLYAIVTSEYQLGP
jgi:hypothetical protein